MPPTSIDDSTVKLGPVFVFACCLPLLPAGDHEEVVLLLELYSFHMRITDTVRISGLR